MVIPPKRIFLLIGIVVFGLAAIASAHLTVHALGGNPQDTLVGRFDTNRSGAYINETILNPGNVKAGQFGKLFSRPVIGDIYAQPLYLSGVTIPGQGVHNVVYVATAHNMVYAYDADDPAANTPLWSVDFGDAQHLNLPPETSTGPNGGLCTCDVWDGEVGILSTPVIDPTTQTIYVVSQHGISSTQSAHYLHALDLTTGAEKFNGPTLITATVPGNGQGSSGGQLTFSSFNALQRPALTLLNGSVYIAFGGTNDRPPFHGWVFGYSASDVSVQRGVFVVTPNGGGGSIWSAAGLATDGTYLYATTGNGTFDVSATTTGPDYGDSVLKLDPSGGKITLADWFVPTNEKYLDGQDLDLGVTGPLLIPGSSRMVIGGKQGWLTVLDRNNLGHYSGTIPPGSGTTPSDTNVVQELDTYAGATSHMHGTPVFWNGPNGTVVYSWTELDYIHAYNISPGASTPLSSIPFSVSQSPVVGSGMPPGILVLSANGSTNGIVWASVNNGGYGNRVGVLYALDANDLTKVLWSSQQNAGNAVGTIAKFLSPMIANGKVYMGSFSASSVASGSSNPGTVGYLDVYGLLGSSATKTPTSSPTFTAIGTSSSTPTKTATSTSTSTSTPTSTSVPSNTPSSTSTSTSTSVASDTPSSTSTATSTSVASDTPSSTSTSTSTSAVSNTPTATATTTATKASNLAVLNTIGVFRKGTFYLRYHNTSGYSNLTIAYNPAVQPLPVVGDWTGVGVDAVGVYDQSNAVFSLRSTNKTTFSTITLSFGNQNDTPLAGRWLASATTAGVGTFRPSNGIIYLKNSLVTGPVDYSEVLGLPGDTGLAGDWTGQGYDSPGVYRGNSATFYLSNRVTNGTVTADIVTAYGVTGDVPVIGDWIAQGHDGLGFFRPSNGTMYLQNSVTGSVPDSVFAYGIAGDVPIAGHWEIIYPGTSTNTPTGTSTSTATNGPGNTATSTSTSIGVPSKTATSTATPTSTATATGTATGTTTATVVANPAVLNTIGVFRKGSFYLRFHNTTGYSNLTIAYNPAVQPLPIVGDWTAIGVDAVGVYDQSSAVFSLRSTNKTTFSTISLSFGNPNDTPLAGRWLASATTAGVGTFRPSNGIIYLKNSLVTGPADYSEVLGLPGDTGLAGDWTGQGYDSPGVYRGNSATFFLSNRVTNGPVTADIVTAYGVVGDLPVIGDWIAQGHDGLGFFRPSNGTMYLQNSVTGSVANNSFLYGIPGDAPIAGHWVFIYPAIAPPVLIAKTVSPLQAPGDGSAPGDYLIGG